MGLGWSKHVPANTSPMGLWDLRARARARVNGGETTPAQKPLYNSNKPCDKRTMSAETQDIASKKLRDLLAAPCVLCANPHYYDYIHFIKLKEGGEVDMVAGGGQALHRQLLGRYELSFPGEDEAVIRFFDITDVNPYDNAVVRERYDEMTYRIHMETGPFAFPYDIPANIPEEQWPWKIYAFRLVFDDDPLSVGALPWPPELAEHPETRALYERHIEASNAARRYYLPAYEEEVVYPEAVKRGLAQ